LYTYQFGASNSPGAAAMMVTGRLSGPTDLAFERAQGGGPISLTWYAVTLNNGAKVIRQSALLADKAMSHQGLGVKAEHAIATAGGLYYRGGATPDTNNSIGSGSVTLDLAPDALGTTLSIARASVLSPVTVDWSVVEFP